MYGVMFEACDTAHVVAVSTMNYRDGGFYVYNRGTQKQQWYDFGHKPVAGPKNKNGDRRCVHYNARGTLKYPGCEITPGPRSGQYQLTVDGEKRITSIQSFDEVAMIDGRFEGARSNSSYSCQWTATVSPEGISVSGSVHYETGNWIGDGAISGFNEAGKASINAGQPFTAYNTKTGNTKTVRLQVLIYCGPATHFVPNMLSYYGYIGLAKTKLARECQLGLADNEIATLDGEAESLVGAMRKVKMYHANGLAYIRDSINLAKPIIKFAEDVRSEIGSSPGRGRLKLLTSAARVLSRNLKRELSRAKSDPLLAAANARLNYEYGIPLYLSDTKRIAQGLLSRAEKEVDRRLKATRLIDAVWTEGAMGNEWSHQTRGKIYYQGFVPTVRKKVKRTLRYFDLFPSFYQLWDLVPYSFVLDWFVPVDQLLERIDTLTDTSTFPILGGCVTTKSTTAVSLPPFLGTVNLSCFRRITYEDRQLSRTHWCRGLKWLDGFSTMSKLLNHGANGVSLIIQRVRSPRR